MNRLCGLLLVSGLVAAGCNAGAAWPKDAAVPGPDGGSRDAADGGVDQGPAARDAAPMGGEDGASATSCPSLSTGPIPADGGDIDYSYTQMAKPACFSAPLCEVRCDGDFLSGLLACAPTEGGYFWSGGSVYVRVHGRKGGACVYDITVETEGDAAYSRCSTPLPVRPWVGLSFIDNKTGAPPPNLLRGLDGCALIWHCSLLPGGPKPCDQSQGGTPTCPTEVPPKC